MSLSRALCMAFVLVPLCFAHPGGLDSKGGHRDRKNGGYHYHRSTSAGTTATAPQETATSISPAPVRVELDNPKPPERLVYHTPQSKKDTTAISPTAAVQSLATTSPLTTASPLAKVTIGMTRAQVKAQLGEPSVESGSIWLYSVHGWVRFRGDAVFNIEAR